MENNKEIVPSIGYKVLQVLYSEGHNEVSFITNDEDEWLIDVYKYTKKNKKIIEHNLILYKDIDRWIEIYKKEGFKIN